MSVCRLLILALGLSLSVTGAAQDPPPRVDPADLGLQIPQGVPVRPGEGRRVVVADSEGQPQVGRVYLEVGDTWVVTMPDGRLRSLRKNEAPQVDRPYQPYNKKQMLESLRKRFAGFETDATNRYVFVYNTSKPFYQATSRILETMYPALFAYCKRERLPVENPETPLVVLMFRTQEEYQAYREMPPEVAAYYNSVSNFVVLYEQSKLAEAAPAIAIKQSISTIAHEGVHQILHNIGVQKRLSDWPIWISEGLPEYFAPTDTDRNVRWAGVGKVNHLRMHALVEYVKANPAAAQGGALVSQTVAARQLTASGYAAAWALTDYLAKNRRDDFFAFLRKVSQAEPMSDAADPARLFEEHFGNDYAGLQQQLFQHLKRLPYVDPIVNQPHYVAVLDTGTLRRVMVTTSPVKLQAWRAASLAELPPAAQAVTRFNVRIFANKAIAERAANSLLQ